MKKILAMAMAAAMVLSFAACSSKQDSSSEEVKEPTVATGTYTVYNTTGDKITELYLHEAGSEDKGENLAGENGMKNYRSKVLTFEGAEDTTLSLEWVTANGDTGSFDTLHIEEAPVALLSTDAAAGATPVKFEVPTAEGVYTVYNTTGETVTELYLYEAGSEDKGENLAGEGLADAASVELKKEGAVDFALVLEFTTESGYTGSFNTLHNEVAPISLLSEDAAAGATVIKFAKPE